MSALANNWVAIAALLVCVSAAVFATVMKW